MQPATTQLDSGLRRNDNISAFHFTAPERKVIRRREKMTVWQHAEKTRVITDGNIKGPWRNTVTPYTVGPMHCWTIPSIRKIFLMWAPQTAKTQVGFNCMNYSIEHDGLSVMYVMPNEKVTKRISKRRIIPMFKASPAMRELLSPRFDDTTTLAVSFTNGADLMMVWATSAAELSSESVPIIILDERDKVVEQVKHLRMKNELAEGMYVPREMFERELAKRLAVFKSDGENFFRGGVEKTIAIVGGDPAKAPQLIEHQLDALAGWLDRYDSDKEFKVPMATIAAALQEEISEEGE